MERVNSKKTVLNIMITFVIFLALVFCFQLKYVFAKENRVYVVEDLPDSTILMPGDVLYIYQDYHRLLSGDAYQNSVSIYYYLDEAQQKYESVDIDSHTHYTIKSYNEIFESDENYSSWKMKITNGMIFLTPSNEKVSEKEETPSKNNSYTLSSDNNYKNNYYLVSQIDNVKNDGWLKNDRNEYYFANKGEMILNQKVTLNFEFYAEVGQYLYFDYRSFLGMYGVPTHNHYFATLNDEKFNIDQALDESPVGVQGYWYSYENFTYDHMLIPIKKTGTQNMIFEYEVINEDNVKVNNSWRYNYGYIRNVMLLTHINSGNQLDISKVPDGANVIYIESNEDDDTFQIGGSFIFESPSKQEEEKEYGCYTCDDELIWTNEPKDNCKFNDDIKSQGMCVNNPKTGITKTILIILIVASFAILVVVLYNRRNRFSKI